MPEAKWKTALTDIEPNQIRIRGYDIADLMANLSHSEAVFLLLKGELPSKAEAALMNAILVSSIDHGPTPPSILAARTVHSGGNSLNAAIAGGILAIGDTHGGAIEQAAKIFQKWAAKIGDEMSTEQAASGIIDWLTEDKRRMPGYGHRLHSNDPRTAKLFEIAKEHGYSGKHINLCLSLKTALEEKLGRKLPINVDGAIAAVISEMGFDWKLGKGFFIMSRVSGLLAHCYEEMTRERPMRKLGPPEYDYDGPKKRTLP